MSNKKILNKAEKKVRFIKNEFFIGQKVIFNGDEGVVCSIYKPLTDDPLAYGLNMGNKKGDIQVKPDGIFEHKKAYFDNKEKEEYTLFLELKKKFKNK